MAVLPALGTPLEVGEIRVTALNIFFKYCVKYLLITDLKNNDFSDEAGG